MPTIGQIALIIVSIAFFVVGGGISLERMRADRNWLRIAAKACMWLGAAAAAALLVWHSFSQRSWLPLDNFDVLVWLGLILAAFVLYVQWRRPLFGLEWFVMPIVILLLAGAALIAWTSPREYDVHSVLSVLHLATAYGGAVAFAVAASAGAMYLIANYRLRRKVLLSGPSMGSLERLEHLTLTAVTIGFALLTIGAITGFIKMRFEHRAAPLAKVILSASVWVVYALVLHSPINPSFRGRRAAVLSIIGFVLMVGTVVAVLLMPGGGG